MTEDKHAREWGLIASAAEKIAASEHCGPGESAAFCAAIDKLSAALMGEDPIDMVLYCPNCGAQHVDAPEYANARNTLAVRKGYEMGGYQEWTNPPHRSHLCHHCGHIWRPADVPTNGVQAVKTRGKNDSPICEPWPKKL